MGLTEQEISDNYQKLIDIIETYISGDRKKKLIELYDQIADRVATAPASSINTFHGCYPGGYVNHVLGVVDFSVKLYNLWKENGADVEDYQLENLVFCAINHDLGKVGDMENDFYIPNTSEWHVKNQGKVYVDNPLLINMSVPDRSIWMLQNAGITISQNEFMAIKLHDGPYVDENKGYFSAFQEHRQIRSNMVFILHYADYMACRIEYEKERNSRGQQPQIVNKPKNQNINNKLSESTASKNASDLFAKMFEKKD